MGIVDALRGRKVYLDANVFIYALEGFSAYLEALTDLFDAIERGEVGSATSELTLAEVLVKPFREGNQANEANYRRAVQSRQGLGVIPISLEVLIEAARLRATSNLRLPDAIHVATARRSDCGAFLTNDKRLLNLSGLEALYLSDFARE